MKLIEGINVAAIIIGPLAAVGVTLWYQTYTDKRNTQRNTFFNLIAYRNAHPSSNAHGAFVNALNTLEIVFHGNKEIITIWHEYYDLLTSETKNEEKLNRKKLQLLSAIGRDLGYSNIQQVDIDKYYAPESWAASFQKNEI